LSDRRDDVAGEVVVRSSAERHVGPDRTRKIFLGDFSNPALRKLAQRLAGIDLMTRDPNVH